MSAVKAASRPRHVPQRTCVGCGTSTAKRQLVRIVRTADGAVQPDPTGKASGRGAYLCDDKACWERAVKKGRLGKSLKVELSRDDRQVLLAYGRQLAGATTP